jgi:hypothetical protein
MLHSFDFFLTLFDAPESFEFFLLPLPSPLPLEWFWADALRDLENGLRMLNELLVTSRLPPPFRLLSGS